MQMRKIFSGSTVISAALITIALLVPAAALAKVPVAVIGKNTVKLEVAQSKEQIEFGLMERQSMPEDQGMVFLFRPWSSVRFWMYDCLMSLDMMFIKDGKIVKISRDVPPYKGSDKEKAPLYPADGEVVVTEVIEVNAGYCKRHGINDGDTVKFDFQGMTAPATSAPAPATAAPASAGEEKDAQPAANGDKSSDKGDDKAEKKNSAKAK